MMNDRVREEEKADGGWSGDARDAVFQHHPGPQTQCRRDDEGQSLRGTTGHPEAQESLSGLPEGGPLDGRLEASARILRRHGSTMLFHAIHIS